MAYSCSQCGHTQDDPGTCPDCSVNLEEKTEEASQEESLSTEEGSES